MEITSEESQETLPMKPEPIVLPAVSPEEALRAWNSYLELKKKIVTKDDEQIIQGRVFLKKSYWRKCATFFNLTVEMVSENKTKEDDGSVTFEALYRATAPNGRSTTGDGACNTYEKKNRDGDPIENSLHNTRGTAHTRSFNRAVSNLIGGGEVSAEEIDHLPEVAESLEVKPAASKREDLPPPPDGWNLFQITWCGPHKTNGNIYTLLLKNKTNQVWYNAHAREWTKIMNLLHIKDMKDSKTKWIAALIEKKGIYHNIKDTNSKENWEQDHTQRIVDDLPF